MVETVERYDFARIGKNIKKTPQGFLKIPAYFTRAGIFTYQKADGKEVREYRPAEEVFNTNTLETIMGAPAVDLHPTADDGTAILVDPKNARTYCIGYGGEKVRRDGEFAAGDVTIMDQKSIDAVLSGDRKEISLGFTCEIDWTPGEVNGQRYDCIQRNIVANHIGIGPANWGRAGSEVALRLDSKAAFLKSSHVEGETMSDVNIRIDNKDFSVSKDAAEFISKAISDRDTKIDHLQNKVGELSGTLEVEKKARLDASRVNSAEAIALAKVMHKAMGVLGENTDFDGQDKNTIMKNVIKTLAPDAAVDGEDEGYVRGMFDALMKAKDPAPVMDLPLQPEVIQQAAAMDSKNTMRADSLARANALALQSNLSGALNSVASAREKMMAGKRDAWTEKLAFSKN